MKHLSSVHWVIVTEDDGSQTVVGVGSSLRKAFEDAEHYLRENDHLEVLIREITMEDAEKMGLGEAAK